MEVPVESCTCSVRVGQRWLPVVVVVVPVLVPVPVPVWRK